MAQKDLTINQNGQISDGFTAQNTQDFDFSQAKLFIAPLTVSGGVSGAYVTATGSNTPRTVADRFAEFTNVKDFGAVGNGTTDDTAAIQGAINYSGAAGAKGGYIVFFPPGVYLISAALLIGSRRIELRGCAPQGSNGTQLYKVGANANVDFINAGTNIIDTFSMENIQLQGDGTTGTGNGVTLGSNATFVADCRIVDCWFNQIPNACINMVNVGGYHITNNGFEQSAYGIYKNSTVLSSQGNNVIATNRFFSLTDGIFIGFSQHDTIIGNHFDSCGAANDLTGAIVLSTNGTEIRGISIVGNNFRANYNDILCTGTASRSSHVGVTVNSVLANSSDFAQRHFFYSAATDGMAIQGNWINDPGQQTTNTFAAIDLEGATANCTVDGNTVSYAGGVTPAYGLQLGSATTGTIIGTNNFNGQSGAVNLVAGCTYTYLVNGVEATFAPTMQGGTTGGATTYSNQLGLFQREGQWVNFTMRVTWSAATGTGFMQLGALPFTSNSTANLLQAVSVGYATLGSGDTTSLVAYIPPSSNFIIINKYAAGGSTALNVEATGDLAISGRYSM